MTAASRITRRTLLRRGGLGLAGLVVGPNLLDRPPGAWASSTANLRKCVALGPRGMLQPGSDQDYRTSRAFLLGAAPNDTKWVKMWVVWPALQPALGYAPGIDPPAALMDPEFSVRPSAYLAALDAQVKQATADGRHLILTCWLTPQWASVRNRVTYAAEQNNRNPRYCLPDDLSQTGPYARLLNFLMARYAKTSTLMIEVINEANLNTYPQSQAPTMVAAMMSLASQLNRAQGGHCLLGGPATSDVISGGVSSTPYLSFTNSLLSKLGAAGFQGDPNFVWTHHNYGDCVHQLNPPRAGRVRSALVGRWNGLGGLGAPQLWLTEGGVSLATFASGNQQTQAQMLQTAISRVANDDERLRGGDQDVQQLPRLFRRGGQRHRPARPPGLRRGAPRRRLGVGLPSRPLLAGAAAHRSGLSAHPRRARFRRLPSDTQR